MKTALALCSVAWMLVACGDVVKSTTDAMPDPCPGAVCECTAATEAMDCEDHEVCNESGGNRQCECAAGYMPAAGDGGCVFAGVIADPGFQDPSKWTAVGNGVTVVADAMGSQQAGELTFTRTAVCEYSSAKQTLTMPPFERADALKVTVTHTIIDPGFPPDFGFGGAVTVQGRLGGQWFEFTPSHGVYKTTSLCLGPAAFGGEVELDLAIMGNLNGFDCSTPPNGTGSLRIDELKVEVAEPGECPRQVGVVNGNFQLSTGWVFPNQQNGSGQILPNIGENGSFGAQLQQPNRCSQVTALGKISIPAAGEIEHPALDIYWNGTSGARLVVQLAGRAIGTLNANSQVKHSRVCIPKWAAGNLTTIGFFAQRISDNNCATALNRTFILDNMTIVDDPACGTLADVTDPSFERIANAMGPAPSWGLVNGIVNDIEGSRNFIINQPANAKTGVGVLRTSNSNQCVNVGEGGAEIAFVVPEATASAGPAVKFFAKADAANVNSATGAILLPGFEQQLIPENGTYVEGKLCISPKLAGRLLGLRLTTGDPDGGGCGATTYEEFGFFDDVQITTDPTCPAQ